MSDDKRKVVWNLAGTDFFFHTVVMSQLSVLGWSGDDEGPKWPLVSVHVFVIRSSSSNQCFLIYVVSV